VKRPGRLAWKQDRLFILSFPLRGTHWPFPLWVGLRLSSLWWRRGGHEGLSWGCFFPVGRGFFLSCRAGSTRLLPPSFSLRQRKFSLLSSWNLRPPLFPSPLLKRLFLLPPPPRDYYLITQKRGSDCPASYPSVNDRVEFCLLFPRRSGSCSTPVDFFLSPPLSRRFFSFPRSVTSAYQARPGGASRCWLFFFYLLGKNLFPSSLPLFEARERGGPPSYSGCEEIGTTLPSSFSRKANSRWFKVHLSAG